MIEIQPTGKISAEVECPPSKSYTNRALLIAALTKGVSQVDNPLFSDDTRYMCEALEHFGISVKQKDSALIVSGTGGQLQLPKREISVGNAGTTMRFLTTFAALAPGITRLTGDERMQERPISDLLSALNQMGVEAWSVNKNGCPPLEIVGGSVDGGNVDLAGNKSSQYLTSILLSAPCFKKDTTIRIVGDLTSKSYADITLDIMRAFGVTVENENYTQFRISAGQAYTARNYPVEGDWSSASYFLAMAAVTEGSVVLTGLNPNSVQGDAGFLNVLEQMGCEVERSLGKIRIKGNPLRGININMNSMPDTVQTLAVTALFAEGETAITGIGNLRIKETDRIDALAKELTRLGASVDAGADYLKIHPGGPYKGVGIETYNDHRMAMSFALAGLKIPGVRIKNPTCVEKSFSDFFGRFKATYE
ncbi:MAG: 3-phosphoshikimate 1-carboxyvinyltransferase [Nitrospinaceae bacterium]|nr:3-phosphoshikimate 1-carboxyvinyltransferase [Nitrospinaceae bacterium]